MAISVKYSDGSEKNFSKTSQSLEAQLLLDNGADINFIYNTGAVKITALDSAYQELEKQPVKNNTQAQKQIQDLIAFLESKGAKRYNELGER
jgi:hypothetical protein